MSLVFWLPLFLAGTAWVGAILFAAINAVIVIESSLTEALVEGAKGKNHLFGSIRVI